MRTLVWSTAFSRAFKRLLRRRSELRERLERVLELLVEDPFNRELCTHKLKGSYLGLGLAPSTMTIESFLTLSGTQSRMRRRYSCWHLVRMMRYTEDILQESYYNE